MDCKSTDLSLGVEDSSFVRETFRSDFGVQFGYLNTTSNVILSYKGSWSQNSSVHRQAESIGDQTHCGVEYRQGKKL